MTERALADFKSDVAARFVEKTGAPVEEAADVAGQVVEAFLADENIEFGDPRYDWTAAGAHEIADTDMSYWEN